VQTVRRRLRTLLTAAERVVGGTGTALLAFGTLAFFVAVALSCLAGIGLVLVPTALKALRSVADRERRRLTRWGPPVIGAGPPPQRLREAYRDRTVRRELAWLVVHASVGLLLGIAGITFPLNTLRDGSLPLWWRLAPPAEVTDSLGLTHITSQPVANVAGLLGLLWLALFVVFEPAVSRLQAWPGRKLLPPPADVDLTLRVAELTATRAAALDAHATELRRIERSLHDGTQNRIVAVTVLLGAARRALARDPALAGELLDRAQGAAEQALAELRNVARGILPPVLADRGLAGALSGLAATCAVPCRIDVDVPGRCAAAVEATAYFVVAELLTNISKHSRAHAATVTVRRRGEKLGLRVEDDGQGGADSERGSGITGIRRRIEALDGHLTLTSPPGGPTIFEAELPCGS
jgi:signal transduction histidine kinase